jgi:uncharacterized membrane protein
MNALELTHHLFLIGIVLLVSAVSLMVPRWTRKDVFFGVTVPVEFPSSPEAMRILRAYRWRAGALSAVALALAIGGAVMRLPWAAPAAILLAAVALFVGYATAHASAREHRAEEVRRRSVTLTPAPAPLPPLLHAIPFLMLAATGVVLALNASALPQQIPVHWDARGEVDRYGSPGSLWVQLLFGAMACGVIGLLAHFNLTRAKRVASTPELVEADAQLRSTISFGMIAIELWMAVLFSSMALLPVLGLAEEAGSFIRIGSIVFVVAVVGWIVRLIRIRTATPASGHGDETADRHWKWGLFYVNPNDPSILVEKRFGIGYTLNFANRRAWMLLAVLLSPAAVMVVLDVLGKA